MPLGMPSHLILPGICTGQDRQQATILWNLYWAGQTASNHSVDEENDIRGGSSANTSQNITRCRRDNSNPDQIWTSRFHYPETGLTFGQKYCFLFAHVESILIF